MRSRTRYAPSSPFGAAMAFFCANVARGEQGSQPPLTGYDVDKLIETVGRSDAAARTVKVNWRTW